MYTTTHNHSTKSGMTIVEVAVVITILSVLAVLVIVVFPGIQQRARTNQARSNASSVEKIADSFAESTGRYPGTTAEFRSNTKLSSSIILLTSTATLTNATGETSVDYDVVGSLTAASGARIRYWDFQKPGEGDISDTIIYLGNASSSSTFINLAS